VQGEEKANNTDRVGGFDYSKVSDLSNVTEMGGVELIEMHQAAEMCLIGSG